MKRPLLLLLILNVAVLNLFAKPFKKTLVEQGLYLASLMKEKASCDSYFAEASLKDDDDLFATLSEFSSDDVSKPTAVYKISGNFTEFMQGIQATPDTKAFRLFSVKNLNCQCFPVFRLYGIFQRQILFPVLRLLP